MARPRADTGSMPKEPHSVSLKVLRLARPALAQQHPLPRDNVANIKHEVSLAIPGPEADQEFVLTPNLILPPAFGLAYIGESFSCTLCANNELADNTERSLAAVRLTAEMQPPTGQPISLTNDGTDEGNGSLAPGESLQRIVNYNLKEEGNHVLIVNVSYTEVTDPAGETLSNSRARSFRKLYQFQAQPCLNVRTKATEIARADVPDKSLGPYGRSTLVRYALEAQLENVSDSNIVLRLADLVPLPPFVSTSLNWDMENSDGSTNEAPLLSPRDVMQLAFLIEQEADNTEGLDELKANLRRDGRIALGQIALEWRSAMGEKGSLTTGMLFSRKRAQ